MKTRKPYPTDLTQEQWNLIAPLLPPEKPPLTCGRWRQAGKQPTLSVVILDSETIKTTDKGDTRAGEHWL